MSGHISRRAAIGCLTAAMSMSAPVMASTPACPVNALWERRQGHLEIARRLQIEHDAANAALPAWAQSGPRMIDSRGKYCGHVCGWPMDETVKPSDHEGWYRICRLSPSDIKEQFDKTADLFGRQQARQTMRAQYRTIIPLIRAQRAERARVGIGSIDAAIESNYDAMFVVENAIEGLPASNAVTAALILLALILNCETAGSIDTDAAMHVASIALDPLRAGLSGLLQDHVEFFLADQSRQARQMPFWGV